MSNSLTERRLAVHLHHIVGNQERVPHTITVEGERISIPTIFAEAKIAMALGWFPDVPEHRGVDNADLFSLKKDAEELSGGSGSGVVVGLVVRQYLPEPRLAGLMFDERSRSAFAVFDDPAIAATPARNFRTAAHELTHVFNLHHQDWGWESSSEKPLPALAAVGETAWELGTLALAHLNEHHTNLVWPGPEASPFWFVEESHAARHAREPPVNRHLVMSLARPGIEHSARVAQPNAEAERVLDVSTVKDEYLLGSR